MSRDNLPLQLYAGTVTDTANGHIGPWLVQDYSYVEIYIGTISFVGGTSPTVTIKGGVVDLQGNVYTQSTSAALAAGAGSNYATCVGNAGMTNKPIGRKFQVNYSLAGAPTSVTFYIEVLARP